MYVVILHSSRHQPYFFTHHLFLEPDPTSTPLSLARGGGGGGEGFVVLPDGGAHTISYKAHEHHNQMGGDTSDPTPATPGLTEVSSSVSDVGADGKGVSILK